MSVTPPSGRYTDEASGRAKAVALTTTGTVLVAAIVTGALALGEDDGGGVAADTVPGAVTSTAADDPAVVVDRLHGITLPLPEGWVRPKSVDRGGVAMTTDGVYDCPAGVGRCRHGTVLTRAVPLNDGKSAEALAKEDIPAAAHRAYDRDALGRRPYGGIESHQSVKSGQVAVAGRPGYLVRWRVRTARGPGGYVQSLALPAGVGRKSPLVVRFVFDAGPDGPPLADMDEIARGIGPAD
ncbi:hypothetical protein [Streptomyces fulvoviolaceus]|uniref:hypothetical protein n=1 Tax=Streptomyces fulvoviolaceus TaxID=285535 RepID=UPI000694AF5D|nr:hypothetical protein [Streptomyces fulvoviolaceus]